MTYLDARMAAINHNMQQESPVVQEQIEKPSHVSPGQSGQLIPALDLVQHLQVLETSIHSKVSELQHLLEQHDQSMKKLLKSHQNSMKQSVKAQIEKSQVDQRRYIDESLQRHKSMVEASTESRLFPSKSNFQEP